MISQVRKRSVLIAGHRTSLSLEDDFWQLLQKLAEDQGLSVNSLIAEIDETRIEAGGLNLSSAVRLYVLRAVRQKAGM
ncbi:ribbon-helix-helix domain-containing protein [Rhodovibrionaceae bacterium A322]